MVITFAGVLQQAENSSAALTLIFLSLIDGSLKYKNKEKRKTGPRPGPHLNYQVKIGPKPGPRGVNKSKCRALRCRASLQQH